MANKLYRVQINTFEEPNEYDWMAARGERPSTSFGMREYMVVGNTEKEAEKKAKDYWQNNRGRRQQFGSCSIKHMESLNGISLEARLKVLAEHFTVIK
ncbi:MAG: hypothetical protein WC852_07755 [Candidatus Nanoarchaeia archaeon]|jgi:hypothetical protein